MRKVIFAVAFLFLVVCAVGCSRTYIATKDRVDIEVAGNQGVIYGPAPAPHRVANPTRDIYSVDIELPTMSPEKKAAAAPAQENYSQPATNVTPKKAEKIK
jgi:hypothetical protein